MKTESVISVHNLQKSYNGKKVLNGISFDVHRGECFCLLGPNGAGKTTTLKILTGFLKADAGSVCLFGEDIQSKASNYRKKISIVPQYPALDPLLTVKENLIFFALLQKIAKRQIGVVVEDLLEFFGLQSIKQQVAFRCSGGEYQRLMVARAFLKKTDLVFMDEPTSGIDILFKNKLWEFFKQIKREGITIFLNTHDLNEAEVLSDRIGFIFNGRLLVIDTPARLKQMIAGITIYVSFLRPISNQLLDLFKKKIKGEILKNGDNGIKIRTPQFSLEILSSLSTITQDNEIVSLETQPPTLNDVFMQLGDNHAGYHMA